MTKKCTRCGEEKDINEFGPKKASPDGHHTRCRKCTNAEKREYLHRPKKEKEVIPEGFHKCSKCEEIKPVERFHKRAKCKDGYSNVCLDCDNKYNRKWVEENRDQHLSTRRKYYQNNIDRERKRVLAYHRKNYTKVYAKYREWVDNNKEHCKEWQREYFRNLASTDPHYRLAKRCRSRISAVLRKGSKAAHTLELLGTSPELFKKYIEQQFVEGMTWQAFMNGEIELDHICPVAYFDFDNPISQYICFNYRNHQPLWKIDNMKKGGRWSKTNQILWSNTIGKEIKGDLLARGIIDSSYEGC